MTLIKTSILSGISTIIKVLTGFISVKIVSLYIGPSGLALVGQFNNFINMISTIASAGVNTGVVKYTAEFYQNDIEKRKIWSSSFKLSLIFIIPIIIILLFFSNFLSKFLLDTDKYNYIFIICGLILIFYVTNGLLISILNGQKEIKKLTIVNITGSFVGLIVTIILVTNYKLSGALISGIISQSIVFIVTLSFVLKSNWFKLSMFLDKIDKGYLIKLLKYSIMTLVSATLSPLSLIIIRNYIAKNFGWDSAGYWQGVWRISETYLLIITTTLGIYYLPKLSSIQKKEELKKEVIYGYKIIMPVVIMMALLIYIFKDFIIIILFTEKFMPMKKLFMFQLIGDIIKIASWLLGYILVAKAMVKLFIFSEIFFVWSFVGLSIFFMNIFGLTGVTIAFMFNYLIYIIFLYFCLKGYLNEK